MAKARERYWVPRLSQLIKPLIKHCHGCKRFHVSAFANPPPGYLPTDRTEGTSPFQVVGIDYARPMAKARERYWVPRLSQLIKRLIKHCHGCKRFHVSAFANPPSGYLPTGRTEGTSPFQVVGIDYAGPIKYRNGRNKEGKAYIVLYACSLF